MVIDTLIYVHKIIVLYVNMAFCSTDIGYAPKPSKQYVTKVGIIYNFCYNDW